MSDEDKITNVNSDEDVNETEKVSKKKPKNVSKENPIVAQMNRLVAKIDGCVLSLNPKYASAWNDSKRSGIVLDIYTSEHSKFVFDTEKMQGKDLTGLYIGFLNRFFIVYKGDSDITNEFYKKEKPLDVLGANEIKEVQLQKEQIYKDFVSCSLSDLRNKIDKCTDGNFLHAVRLYIIDNNLYDDKSTERSILDYITDRIQSFTIYVGVDVEDITDEEIEEEKRRSKSADNVIFRLR